MYLGASAESPSACLSLLTAALMLWSNSTTVSFGPKLLLDFLSGDDLAAAFHQHYQDLEGLFVQADGSLTLAQLSCPKIDFKDPEAHAA